MSITGARLRSNLGQFIRFGMVGGSGVIVNMAVVWFIHRFIPIADDSVVLNLLGTRFNIRWYHIAFTLAFLVANTWNYQLNRWFTFQTETVGWMRGFWKFLVTGLGALVVNLAVGTLLMNPTSPIHLPTHIFDDSSGFRTRVYWANLIAIVVAMPVNFVFNKLWTFRRR